MEKCGAFGEKKMYGKVTKGVIRFTVWVGPDGKVKKHWPKVDKTADHPVKVLEALRSAQKQFPIEKNLNWELSVIRYWLIVR